MNFTYPSNDLQRPGKFIELLGSAWASIYSGRALLEARMQAKLELEQQAYQDANELFDAISRSTVPVFHREEWEILYLKESEMNAEAAVLRYDDPDEAAQYDGSPQFFYDVPRQIDYVFSLPTQLADCYLLTNRLTEPSVVLHKNIDFRIDLDKRALVLRENPFENADMAIRQLFSDGEATDREVGIWLHRAQYDWEHIYTHFGHALGYRATSSEAYRSLVDTVLDAIVRGTSLAHIEKVVSLMSGIPLTEADGETVVDVQEDRQHLLVITDQQVYKHNREATAAVAIGDTLRAGQPLITAYERWELRRGEVSENVPALAIGRGLLSPEFRGDLLFENVTVDLNVTGDAGSERVQFEVGGHPLDVEYFWDLVHQNRLVYGASLYELLDANGGVPDTVNPLEFLAANLLRNNVLVIRLDATGFSDEAMGLGPSLLLRRITPPHMMVILLVELPTMSVDVTMANIEDESGGTGDATGTGEDSMTSQNIDVSDFTAKTLRFTCH